MNETPLKTKAEEIMVAVSRDLQAAAAKPPAEQAEIDAKATALVDRLFSVVSDVDIDAATLRVEELRQKYPNLSAPELAQKIISLKCQKTGTVGAVTAGAGLLPGLGTAAALTLGTAADIGVTFKMQAELVLEVAAVYNYPLSDDEKQRLVLVITGLSAGAVTLARQAGQQLAIKAGEEWAGKALLKAIPVAGMLASAGTNVLSTYIIGQRADAYFRLGPQAVGSWGDSVRAISGIDERKIGAWLAESGKNTGLALAAGAGKVSEMSKVAGSAVMTGAGKVAETVGPAAADGAKMAGAAAQRGVAVYWRWTKNLWLAFFRFLGWVWAVIAFIPRKIGGLFRRKSNRAAD